MTGTNSLDIDVNKHIEGEKKYGLNLKKYLYKI